MNTQLHTRISVTEKKKAEIDRLILAVANAQTIVDEKQVLVDSFRAKSQRFADFLTAAGNSLSQAEINQSEALSLIQQASVLVQNATTATREMASANKTTNQQAQKLAKLIEQLILSAEVVSKLQTVIVRKKAKNPLISDELISLLAQAGTEGNNAIALCMVALESTFASQASSDTSKNIAALSKEDCLNLLNALGDKNDPEKRGTLLALLTKAVNTADNEYTRTKDASDKCGEQLDLAVESLSAAMLKLKSLQAQLAAAQAAALTS